MIPTVEENLARLAEIKAKMLEAVDFITTWEEQEEKKRSATPTEFQEKDEDIPDESEEQSEEPIEEEDEIE